MSVVRVCRKVFKAPDPLILFRHDSTVDLGAVGQKADRDARRSLAVLIIIVFPGLGAVKISRYCALIDDRNTGLLITFL